ncbi:MAG: ABC transporter ATP-binding protein, partial [Succinivibrionaceae bacterium]|nr:ABC transporter ATP-binding protein [Succinivibrionaceae bacterium]
MDSSIDSEQQPVVEIRTLSHCYRNITAVDRVDLTIGSGITVGLVGADGVGKSTLLSLIAGTRIIQQGSVRVFGRDLSQDSSRNELSRRIAFMPQGLGKNLYPTLSVRENISFHADLFGLRGSFKSTRINRLLAATSLSAFADRAAGKLSGGMKQKLSLCCALIHSPDLLILDEPTTGVDPLSRRQFWQLVSALMKETPGMTVIISTAYIDEAEGFDHTLMMDSGRIIADRNTRELMAEYGAATLEEAYMKILPPEKRGKEGGFIIPPLESSDGEVPAIKALHLTKKFGGFTAVNDVSFEISRGEIFGFLGSNGCGKSTTMKMLTGLLEPTGGEALIMGETFTAGDSAVKRKVGYMSQAFSLYEELTVTENLFLHAKLYHIPILERYRAIRSVLERFGLYEYRHTTPKSLSLGIKQRLQLAAACLHNPEILILDEPTSGVDPAARDLFWE